MHRFGISLITLLLLTVSFSHAQTPGEQVEMKTGLHYNYLLHLPASYDENNPPPFILFLHGAGERGSNLSSVAVHGPPKLTTNVRYLERRFEWSEFPFVVVSPQCPTGEWWQNEHLIELMNEVMQTVNVDQSRMYMTGLSMGGFGTWSFASEYPNFFAAIVPICGSGDAPGWSGLRTYTQLDIPKAKIEQLVGIPVWAFHGESDTVVPINEQRQTIEAFQAAGGDAQFTTYPGVGHDSWTTTYNNKDVYDWLLSHQKKQASVNTAEKNR
ncbi:MAG: prolyl oligopeptidase family serine peptidase [Candidatus Hinthialibacter antarcticus]|nr:prolyl oligopeptidase family serine peptidase [Candidatus Hinthialibacter antarcticus]